MLNESNLLNSRTNMTAIEPTREQPSYFNARESIIPKLPETPKQQEIRQEVKPPPTPKQSNIQQEIKQLTPFEADLNQMKSGVISNFSTREKKRYEKDKDVFDKEFREGFKEMYNTTDVINKTLQDKKKKDDLMKKVREQTALLKKKKQEKEFEDKIHKGLNESEAAYEREISKLETQVNGIKKRIKPQQSTAEFLNMTFTPPKRDIVEMMTPQKEPITTALTPYRENRSLLDFAIGGTPQKTAQQIKAEKDIKRIKEIKHSTKPKHVFEYNTLKSGITGQPDPNPKIASSMINRAIKSKLARKELKQNKRDAEDIIIEKSIKHAAAAKIQGLSRGIKTRNKLSNDTDFKNKIELKIKKYGDAASEYKTRGADKPNINSEFSDVMKNMRKGLQNYNQP
jgi:hypothetical protein